MTNTATTTPTATTTNTPAPAVPAQIVIPPAYVPLPVSYTPNSVLVTGPTIGEALGITSPTAPLALSLSAQTGIPAEDLLNLPADLPTPTGVFQAMGADGVSQLYALVNGEVIPLFENTGQSDFFPSLDESGNLIAFQSQTPDGQRSLRLHDLSRGLSLALFRDTPELRLTDDAPAWLPGAEVLLITLEDANGLTGLYQINLRGGTPPLLLIPNGAAGSYSPNARLIAFEQVQPDGTKRIAVARADAPENVQRINDADASCKSPRFDSNSVTLFFSCEVNGTPTLFTYGIGGVNPFGLAGDNPQPGPAAGYMAFDDGASIYYGYTDGGNAAPMIELGGQQVSHLSWTSVLGQ
ncbi:MAG: TolB family protein [Phototrophicaceae bacterium]